MQFDGNEYRKKVLLPLLKEGDPLAVDPFVLFDLPPETDDQATIDARIKQVVGHWRKEQTKPRVSTLAEILIKNHEQLAAKLRDPRERAKARTAAVQGEQAKLAEIDEIIAEIVAQSGGLPTSKLGRLRQVATHYGLTEAGFEERIRRERIIDDGGGDTTELLSPALRKQMASVLSDLARLQGRDPRGFNLFSLLDLPNDADRQKIQQRREERIEANRRRAHDREMQLTSEALALVKAHLLDADRAIYLNGLVEDAKDRIRTEVHKACLLSDTLSAHDFDAFTRRLYSEEGLTAAQSRRAVAALAKEVGAPVEIGGVVDYITCANCGSAEPDDGRERCRRCGTALHQSCPQCSRSVAVDALVCSNCGTSFRALRAAQEHLQAARRNLQAGRPMAARAAAAAAAAEAPTLQGAAAVRDEADAVIRDAARGWNQTTEALQTRRLYSAQRELDALARKASDVQGPHGEDATQLAAEVRERIAAFERRLNEARGLALDEREAALVVLANEIVDAPRLEAELARTPPEPPRELTARLASDGAHLSWRPSSSAGQVTYSIHRLMLGPDGTLTQERSLGQTGDRQFVDGRPPANTGVAYEVRAIRAGTSSAPVRSMPMVRFEDVTHFAVDPRDGEVALRWRHPGGSCVVQLERIEENADGTPAVTRRIRPDPDGYVDKHVKNGTTYRYRAYVELRPAVSGAPAASPGVVASVRPRARLRPVAELFAARGDNGHVRLTYVEPQRGDGRVLRLHAGTPAPRPGTSMTIPEFERLGTWVTPAGPGAAVDARPPNGAVEYLVAVLSDGDAIPGGTVIVQNLPTATGLSAQDDGNRISLRWTWPQGCTECLVLWRQDRFPAGPHDELAERKKVTNMGYELKDGWTLEHAAPGPYFFAVFTGARIHGELQWASDPGPGGRVRVREAPARAVWDLRSRRSGILGRKGMEVTITVSGAASPDLVAVGKAGSAAPLSREDGAVLGSTSGGIGELVIGLDPGRLQVPFSLAVFTARPDEAELVDIAAPVSAVVASG